MASKLSENPVHHSLEYVLRHEQSCMEVMAVKLFGI